jgi:integrase
MDHPLDLTADAPASIQTITARLRDRAEAVNGATQDGAPADFPSPAPFIPSNAGPLPGLEPVSIEKAEHNQVSTGAIDLPTGLGPLPGTSFSQRIENAGGSSERRSPERVCYDKLLREDGPSSPGKSQKTVLHRPRGCYGKLLPDLPKGVLRRGHRLYYRHTVPVDAQRILNRLEIWRSLRTDSIAVAARRLPSVVARIEMEIEQARAMAGMPIDPALILPLNDDSDVRPSASPPAPSRVQADTALTLGEAYRSYIDDPTRAWTANTREAYETSRKLAIAVIGEALPIASVSRTHCRDFLDVLRFLPANAGKLFPKLSPREAADRARLRGDIKIISAANANSLMSNTSSFLNWAVNEELLARNPARGLRLPDPVNKRDKRLPFEREQLHAIFNAPLYRGCVDGERGYNKVGNQRPRNARYWVPLIALFTGARLGEICQLDTTDIRVIDGVSCIVVSQRSMSGSTDKHLKTGASDRLIPVHPTLIDCGLLHFAEAKRKAGETKLFDDIDTGSTGSRPVAFSKWFTQFLRACAAQKSRTSFHSFRHNFRDELRAARVDHDIAMLLGGWTTGSARTAVSENYGSGYRVDALNEAVRSLSFEQVDVRHLA